jgi:NAD(P)-dependent dehydrogenase (short-subunit alcohol dehydrogenase family)
MDPTQRIHTALPGRRFDERVVIVTGGAAGIGAASAHAFASEGASTFVFDQDADAGAKLEASVRADGGCLHFRHGDVTDETAVRTLVAEAVREYGRLDVLHANAGIEWLKGIVDTTHAEWTRVIEVNLTGVYLAARHAMIEMIRAGHGSIVITSSPHALVTVPDAGAYAASKGGALALTRALALEGAPHGIRANALLPGAIDTPMLRREAAAAPDPARQLERFAAIHPLNRLGQASEVAAAVLFLASDAASFITGAALPVDGGMLAAQPGGPPVSYGG